MFFDKIIKNKKVTRKDHSVPYKLQKKNDETDETHVFHFDRHYYIANIITTRYLFFPDLCFSLIFVVMIKLMHKGI